MAKEKKIALPDMLLALDKCDRDWYNRLDSEQKKEFAPWLAMRFASSVDGPAYLQEHYLLTVNDLCNVNYSGVGKEHDELHWLTLQLAGIGKKQLHPFIQPPKRKSKNKAVAWLAEKYPHMSAEEVELWIGLNTQEDIKDLAQQLGMSDSDIKTIFG